VLPAIDRWLLVIFAPHRIEQTIREMQAAQDSCPAVLTSRGQDTEALTADCDARLAPYQAALDAGADPKAVAEWTRQVQAEPAAVLARAASQEHRKPAPHLIEDETRKLITGLGDLRDVIHDAEPAVKAAIHEQFELKEAASHADPRTTMRYDRARGSLDRHATYIVAAYVAGAAR
jgi:site-specific DNA recombinase